MKREVKRFILLCISFSCFFLAMVFLPHGIHLENRVKNDQQNGISEQFVYLSDIPYMQEQSSVGWGTILLDKSYESKFNNGLITLYVDGIKTPFIKGISAHATSTLVYDLSSYQFDFFTAYLGLDQSRGQNGNGIKFYIYTSEDCIHWNLETSDQPQVLKGTSDSVFVKINIQNKKYLKLYCYNNGNDNSDHAVYANAKLIKDGYVEQNYNVDFIKTIDQYDEIIKRKSLDQQLSQNELVLLQREFVKNIGYDVLQAYARYNVEYKEALEWLMTDVDHLRLYVTGGKPTGSYGESLKVFFKLYHEYKLDFSNSQVTSYGTHLGVLYQKMMISLSLTHSANVCLWVGGNQCSDAVTRYAIYKRMHQAGILNNQVFESLTVEEMRWVMNNNIDDEEIEWLNGHIRRYPTNSMPYNIDPYRYITYRFGYQYGSAKYYDSANYDSWDQKYNLSQYHLTYQVGKPKLWIVFEEGSVCGGISKTGSNINASLGNPSAVIGQPGHAAYLEYVMSNDHHGMWTIKNNISGWTQSEKSERLLLGWGSNNWDSYYQVSYVPYAQEAINDFQNLEKAIEIMILKDVYSNNLDQQEQIYRKALEYQGINMDAWYGLISVYNAGNKSEEDYYRLAQQITTNLKYFPLPMIDLLNLIQKKFVTAEYKMKYTLLEKRALEEGSKIQTGSLQPSITRTMANYLLGRTDHSIATFSFDGENAGAIMLSNRFDTTEVRYEYSLDGGSSWTATSDRVHLLTSQEIESISVEHGIQIHIVGVNLNSENIETIIITEGSLPSDLYANDLENRVVGVTPTMEWRLKEGDSWNSYQKSLPDLTGNVSVEVRVGATGTSLPSVSKIYQFTEDNQSDTRKYVPVSRLSIAGVSTQATSNQGHAVNAIDGNYNTRWHSAWNGTDQSKYIIIKFDKPIMLSAMDYVPAGGGNGKILEGSILVSQNGTDFTEISHPVWKNNDDVKTLEFEDTPQVQYVKIVGVKTSTAGGGSFIGARMFNFYQDITQHPEPMAGLQYSSTECTNQDVIVQLVSPSTPITITNNNGSDTYTFTENGTFTFEFVDEDGVAGMTTAMVDWIDKIAPTANVMYNIVKSTRNEVVATLKDFSEEVTILNNDGKDTYTFSDNGSFEFQIQDKAGNISVVLATVDWIDLVPPTALISYDKETLTNDNVVASIISESEAITVLNNGGKRTYTFTENGSFQFQIQDAAGNVNEIEAKVDWIDKVIPTVKVDYSTMKETNQPVAVTIQGLNKDISIINNNGKDTYTFLENGKFTFWYQDSIGNIGKTTVMVDWIIHNPHRGNLKSSPNINKEIQYQNYVLESISLRLPKNSTDENIYLRNRKSTLDYELKKQLDGVVDCFELYFEKANGERVDDISVSMDMVITIHPKEKLLGVYEVKDSELILLPYEKIGESGIKLTVQHLGQYVLLYEGTEQEEVKEIAYATENQVLEKMGTNKSFILFIGFLVVCVLFILFRKRRVS